MEFVVHSIYDGDWEEKVEINTIEDLKSLPRRLKANLDTNGTIVLNKINSHVRKDLVSSFCYGLYYISTIEEEEKRKKNRG